MSTRLGQINLCVADMAATIEFYRLLGLDIPDSFDPDSSGWPEGSGAHHVEA